MIEIAQQGARVSVKALLRDAVALVRGFGVKAGLFWLLLCVVAGLSTLAASAVDMPTFYPADGAAVWLVKAGQRVARAVAEGLVLRALIRGEAGRLDTGLAAYVAVVAGANYSLASLTDFYVRWLGLAESSGELNWPILLVASVALFFVLVISLRLVLLPVWLLLRKPVGLRQAWSLMDSALWPFIGAHLLIFAVAAPLRFWLSTWDQRALAEPFEIAITGAVGLIATAVVAALALRRGEP